MLPGKTLVVGLCLWRLAGLKGNYVVWLTNEEVATVGVDRYAKSRALKRLHSAGLIEVEHRRGRIPLVTIKLPGESGGVHDGAVNVA